jgi:hypothetical protein
MIMILFSGNISKLRFTSAQGPVGQGGPSSCQFFFYDGFLLMWYNLKFLTIPIRLNDNDIIFRKYFKIKVYLPRPNHTYP